MSTKEMACSMIYACNLDDEAMRNVMRYIQFLVNESEKQTATVQLLNELAEGEQSATEHDWLSPEDVERELGLL
jgi:hypothetical protein